MPSQSVRITGAIEQDTDVDWYADVPLNAAAVLVSPLDVTISQYTNNASPNYPPSTWEVEPVIFVWTGGSGILQICENTSFRGASLISLEASTGTIVNLRRGAGRAYYWRVFISGVSPASEVGRFVLGWLSPDISAYAPEIPDGAFLPTGYDLVNWADPVVGKLYQANILDLNTAINPATGLPVADISGAKQYAGTIVQIGFNFQEADGYQFTGWIDSPIQANMDIQLLRNADTGGGSYPAVAYEINEHAGDASLGLVHWDASYNGGTYNQTFFIESTKNVSVGTQFILQVSFQFNTDLPYAGTPTVTYRKVVTVEARDEIRSPYALSLNRDLSVNAVDVAVGKYLTIQGDLDIKGQQPLSAADEGTGQLAVIENGGRESVEWLGLGSTLKLGMTVTRPIDLSAASGTVTRYGYIVVIEDSVASQVPYYKYFWYWASSEFTQAQINEDFVFPYGTKPITMCRKVCVTKWIGREALTTPHDLIGIKFESGDWLTPGEVTTPNEGEVYAAEDAEAEAVPLIGSDGSVERVPLGAVASSIRRVWRKLRTIHFEGNNVGYPSETPDDLYAVLASTGGSGTAVDPYTFGWQKPGQAIIDPSSAVSGALLYKLGAVWAASSAPATGSIAYYNGEHWVMIGQPQRTYDMLYWDDVAEDWTILPFVNFTGGAPFDGAGLKYYDGTSVPGYPDPKLYWG